jgi:hypothetical protein
VPKLKTAKVESLKKNYPITEEEIAEFKSVQNDPESKTAYTKELKFIEETIAQNNF